MSGSAQATWSFLTTLRTLREVQSPELWLAGKVDGSAVLWLRGDGTECAVDSGLLQAIRAGHCDLDRVILQRTPLRPVHQPVRSAAELSWFAGYHASDRLAPSLSPATAYRIRRWPDFGSIRPSSAQIRATALLATTGTTVSELAARLGLQTEEATRTLNALWACNVLFPASETPDAPNTTPRLPREQPVRGLRSLLQLLRQHLGLT